MITEKNTEVKREETQTTYICVNTKIFVEINMLNFRVLAMYLIL